MPLLLASSKPELRIILKLLWLLFFSKMYKDLRLVLTVTRLNLQVHRGEKPKWPGLAQFASA